MIKSNAREHGYGEIDYMYACSFNELFSMNYIKEKLSLGKFTINTDLTHSSLSFSITKLILVKFY